MYLKYNISIQNNNKRLFPDFFSNEMLEINEAYTRNLSIIQPKSIKITYKKIDLFYLIKYLADLRLSCQTININEGFFTWGENAYIYYSFKEERSLFTENLINTEYIIGGSNKLTVKRLEKYFIDFINFFYGPIKED
jgi:hypothetical protein